MASENMPAPSRLRGEMAALALDKGADLKPQPTRLQPTWRPASLVIPPQYLASLALVRVRDMPTNS